MNISSFGRRLLAAANGTFAGTIIGLGTAAFKNTGTSGNTVPLLDGVNTWSGAQTFSDKPVLSGGAVSFPATQVASAGANDLDDYEEGSWTPGVSFGNGTTGLTYTLQSGSYTKIGRAVFLQGHMNLSAKGSSTGQARLTGLPFSAAGSTIGSVNLAYFGNMASLVDGIYCLINGSAATTGDFRTGNAATVVGMTEAHFTNTSDLYFTAVYFA